MDRKACPVDVIALYSTNGDMRPLRFRMEDEDSRFLCVDIEQIVSCREIQYVGIEARVFLCYATIEDKRWLFELRYMIRSHSWDLIRKVY